MRMRAVAGSAGLGRSTATTPRCRARARLNANPGDPSRCGCWSCRPPPTDVAATPPLGCGRRRRRVGNVGRGARGRRRRAARRARRQPAADSLKALLRRRVLYAPPVGELCERARAPRAARRRRRRPLGAPAARAASTGLHRRTSSRGATAAAAATAAASSCARAKRSSSTSPSCGTSSPPTRCASATGRARAVATQRDDALRCLAEPSARRRPRRRRRRRRAVQEVASAPAAARRPPSCAAAAEAAAEGAVARYFAEREALDGLEARVVGAHPRARRPRARHGRRTRRSCGSSSGAPPQPRGQTAEVSVLLEPVNQSYSVMRDDSASLKPSCLDGGRHRQVGAELGGQVLRGRLPAWASMYLGMRARRLFFRQANAFFENLLRKWYTRAAKRHESARSQ